MASGQLTVRSDQFQVKGGPTQSSIGLFTNNLDFATCV